MTLAYFTPLEESGEVMLVLKAAGIWFVSPLPVVNVEESKELERIICKLSHSDFGFIDFIVFIVFGVTPVASAVVVVVVVVAVVAVVVSDDFKK